MFPTKAVQNITAHFSSLYVFCENRPVYEKCEKFVYRDRSQMANTTHMYSMLDT